MSNNQPLTRTIAALYRRHCGLFWKLVVPVSIIAIVLEVVMFYHTASRLEEDIAANRGEVVVTANVNTISGVHPTVKNEDSFPEAYSGVNWQFFVIPNFSSTDGKGVTWTWSLNFRHYEYSLFILLLLTLSPLSLAVVHLRQESTVPMAREIWRATRQKALRIFGATFLLVIIVDIPVYLHGLLSWLFPDVFRFLLPIGLTFALIAAVRAYFLVTLSLYSPCLMLEDNSILDVFGRSHRLTRGSRVRFFGIYLVTGWLAWVLTSVVFGIALLLFSFFIGELAPVREALSPLKFLSLFVGSTVEIVLPQLLSVPATVAIIIVKGLIATFLVPIWAILTTLLYLERRDATPDTI